MSSGPDDRDRASASAGGSKASIIKITLDDESFVRRRPEVEHEREVALFDLLERNHFELTGEVPAGPYHLFLFLREDRLVFDVRTTADEAVREVELSTRRFRSLIKDYFLICESYFDAIKTKTPMQIEAIDMGRRGLHNEGADVLRERLSAEIVLDHATARRLFTLLCVLHMRG